MINNARHGGQVNHIADVLPDEVAKILATKLFVRALTQSADKRYASAGIAVIPIVLVSSHRYVRDGGPKGRLTRSSATGSPWVERETLRMWPASSYLPGPDLNYTTPQAGLIAGGLAYR
jgi:hypothetical protein